MLRIAITGVLQSLITSLLTLKQTAIIKATETTFSASKKNKSDREFRFFFQADSIKHQKKGSNKDCNCRDNCTCKTIDLVSYKRDQGKNRLGCDLF